MKLPTLLTIVFLLFSTAVGCEEKHASAPASSAESVVMPHGFKAKCLTCGDHEFDVLADTARTDHAGATYYFCTPDCKAEFLKNPDTYVKKATPAAAPASQATTRPT